MKKLLTFSFLLLFSLSLTAQEKQTRTIGTFTKLFLGTHADVKLSKGPFQVVLEGENLQDVQTIVENGELKIKRKEANWSFFSGSNNNKLVVYLSMPALEGVSIGGSGKVSSEDEFHAQLMHLKISGSGDIQLRVAADKVDAVISGSGDIRLKGVADALDARISGSGTIKADQLAAKEVEVHISGSGDCYVNASQKVDARISGSGDVQYIGNPTHVNTKTSGSGSVSKRG